MCKYYLTFLAPSLDKFNFLMIREVRFRSRLLIVLRPVTYPVFYHLRLLPT